MSIAALNWARPLPFGKSEKFVLMMLAERANAQGECFPSVPSLAAETGFSDRTIQRAIRQLMRGGALVVDHGGGRHRSSRYVLQIGTAPAPLPEPETVTLVTSETVTFLQETVTLPPNTVTLTTETVTPMSPKPYREPSRTVENLLPPTPFGTDLLAAVPAPPDLVGRAIGIWNDVCGPFCGRVQKMTEQRRRRMRTVIVNEFHGSMEDWLAFCDGVAATPFLVGTNDRGWVADFDWMLTPANFVKVSEGKYLRSGPAVGASALRRELGLGFLDDAPAFEGVTLNGD